MVKKKINLQPAPQATGEVSKELEGWLENVTSKKIQRSSKASFMNAVSPEKALKKF